MRCGTSAGYLATDSISNFVSNQICKHSSKRKKHEECQEKDHGQGRDSADFGASLYLDGKSRY
jgi:hypothetical protein